MKGFSKEEIDNFSYTDLLAIDKAIYRVNGETAKTQFLAQDYLILKQAQPTDKKGKPNTTLQRKYQKQAQKLFNLLTTGKEEGIKEYKKPLTQEEINEVMQNLKRIIPKFDRKLEN